MNSKKNILVCPLDWGLGHATRMVPVINEILRQGANVIIAADNSPLEFLKNYYPELLSVKLSGFQPVYPDNGSMALTMLRSFPEMRRSAKAARIKLKEIILKYKIDAVVSDNRYELSSDKIYSVFVTHQLRIKTFGIQKLADPIIRTIMYNYLRKYDEIWVPDNSERTLSGDLSEVSDFSDRIFFVGILSRFSNHNLDIQQLESDLLILLSGPEPQRSILENKIIEQCRNSDLNVVVFKGKPDETEVKQSDNLLLIPHAQDDVLASYILSAKNIICRPGYSTLMDLYALKKDAIFVPTPGQTEQEYLANKLMNEGRAYFQNQLELNVNKALKESREYSANWSVNNYGNLNVRVSHMLNNC